MIETAILTIRGERFLFHSAAHLLGENAEADRKAIPVAGPSSQLGGSARGVGPDLPHPVQAGPARFAVHLPHPAEVN